MKGNDGSGNIPERDTWETPQKLWDELNKQYEFTFDCCASNGNNKCSVFSTDFEGNSSISRVAWMNPPFSLAERMFKHFFKVVDWGVAIYRCDNLETALWQEVILKNADWIFIPKGRISYEGKEGTGSRFPSALIGIGVDKPNLINGFTLKVLK